MTQAANQTLQTALARIDTLETDKFDPAVSVPVTVAGSRGDGTALANLLTALANIGLITNSTTA